MRRQPKHIRPGNLYRRLEVDRAIRIHQNLIARSELEEAKRTEALLELGHDYLSAGLWTAPRTCFVSW